MAFWIIWSVWMLMLVLAWGDEQGSHSLSQVLFVQPQSPSPVLLKMFDDEQMFQYNFTDKSVVPRVPAFKKWASQDLFSNSSFLEFDIQLCTEAMQNFTTAVVNITPETKGILDIKVFTLHPLTIGKPNTLVCFISNIIPPDLDITWRKNGILLTKEISYTGYFALSNREYQTFSYLNITPTYTDSYTCNAQVWGSTTTVAYWVPEYPTPSEILENVLCYLAIALGIVFLLMGLVFLFLAWKLHKND